jgi:protein SCO1
MSSKMKIAIIYGSAVLVSAIILFIAFSLRGRLAQFERPIAVNTGVEKTPKFFSIDKDLEAKNQNGVVVKLSDLKGKVFIVAEFFAVCPHCAVRNGADMRELITEFGSNPNFHIACISIDPETDNIDKLKDYSSALNADPKNWWFLTTDNRQIAHDYMDKTLKFFSVRERTDPADIESNGRYSHDLGLMLVNQNFEVVGKWPIAESRKDPALYEKLKAEMYAAIREQLANVK